MRTAENYNQTIEFVDISEYASLISDELTKISEKWTIGTLYRMFIADALPLIEKVIYIDCDVLVNLDINELWNIELEGNSLAGVHDEVCYKKNTFSARLLAIKLCGGNLKSYINAGVTIMNLHKIRKAGSFCNKSIKWFSRYAYLLFFPDQDALNAIFINDIKFIDERFNLDILNRDISNSIFHMWRSKPWKEFTNAPHQILYWDMYLRSAWGENITPHELIEKLSIISGNMKHSSKQCLRRVAGAVWKRITFREQRKIIMLILSDIIHRLKYKFSQ